ncbi:pkd domain-containing protein [Chrysochromulina tobinii]|uniref:Pkd domain-containing protein n=1 Tax=Chrysochromulina tobinii TaxID=1460289 RepID=A0A0M0K2W0_9EUKA|nr:pkd domain-containing protein [Chrysochromulina tobinii]|eukprot:KOO32723.1 pkd domain-containing protein [Chrysochromulina sp. CCMP291]
MSTIESPEWAVQSGGTGPVHGFGIAHDGAGGALVSGYFSGNASFGSTSLASRGTEDAFVMHVTASGAIDWAVQAGDHGMLADHIDSGTFHDPGYGIAHDGEGGAFLTGYFMDSASFGSTLLESRGLADAFVMHVTASGAIDWVVQAGGGTFTSGRGIAHDGAGGALVTGDFSDRASFGSTLLESRGLADAFVMHVTASGVIDWAVQAGGESLDQGWGIAHDGAGGALVTGYFGSTAISKASPVASFGSTSLIRQGSADAFVMHVTASGTIDWAVQAGGADANTGGYSIAHDGAGGALVTGDFNGKVSFGSTSLIRQGIADAFVMHVTASGAIDWAVQAGGADTKTGGFSIAHDGVGGALVAGDFDGNASFGSTSLIVQGGRRSNAFVMHVTASGAIDWAVGSSAHPRAIAHDGEGSTLIRVA